MKFWLNWGLVGSLLWAATGCCCYDRCGNGYGGNGYGNYGYPSTYNTVPTGGYSAMAQNQTQGQNQTQTTAINGATGMQQQNYSSGQMANLPTGTTMNSTMMPSQSGTPCPCETGSMSGQTYYQDANGMPMSMEGMVYDASVVPTPVTAPPTADPSVYQTPPAALQPVPQPEIGIPVGTDGVPLVPPAS
jgi:hypothetical protein